VKTIAASQSHRRLWRKPGDWLYWIVETHP
jgi:hypothetical protein